MGIAAAAAPRQQNVATKSAPSHACWRQKIYQASVSRWRRQHKRRLQTRTSHGGGAARCVAVIGCWRRSWRQDGLKAWRAA